MSKATLAKSFLMLSAYHKQIIQSQRKPVSVAVDCITLNY